MYLKDKILHGIQFKRADIPYQQILYIVVDLKYNNTAYLGALKRENNQLSNNVYHYDKELRKLTMATDTPNKRLDGIVAEMPLVYENEKKR